MKKITLSLCMILALTSSIYAEDPKQPPPKKNIKTIALVAGIFIISAVTIILACQNKESSNKN